jgi:uncharacterized protein (DUF2342 family)
MPLPDIGDIFKDLVWTAMITAAKQALFAAVPWLGWGPIGVFVGFVIGLLAEHLYDAMKLAIDMRLIVFKNEQHRKAFDDASVKLKIIASGKGIDSPEYREAREEHKKRLSDFVKFY